MLDQEFKIEASVFEETTSNKLLPMISRNQRQARLCKWWYKARNKGIGQGSA
jgi:hypothetical protein